MKLKIAAIAIGLISTTSICHANTANSYAVDKEYAEFENGTEILINASSQATVKPNSDTNDIAEIFISPSDDKNISHNKYDTFRVDNSGVILNNVKSKADYIINEVINGPTSLLEGNIDVKGKIAHVIIANPNGITCDNCSFSNTLSETLVSGSVDRSNNSVAIYNLASLIPKSYYLHHKFSPARGKVAIINSKNIDNDTMYRQLNIISNGITVNTKVVSSKDVILYNNGNRIVHDFDNKFTKHVSSIRPLITPNKYRVAIPKINFITIGNGKNRDTTPPNLIAGIHSDHKINIYSNNAKVDNHGYLSSEGMYLSLTNNSTFKNHNQIYTSNLVLDRDNNSWVINEKLGYINHYLPVIFSSSATYEEINSNEINNNEAIRINNLIDNQEIINHGVVKLLTLMYIN